MKKKSISKFIFSITLVQLVGALGALWTTREIGGWYATLARPWFAPPNWLFGPVWTVLYLLMGIALYRFWISDSKKKDFAFIRSVYLIHFIPHIAWTWFFFSLHRIDLAFIDILVMDVMVAWILYRMKEHDKRIVYFLAPYLGWILFATALNYVFLSQYVR
ncbi:MAG: tryptophan-rich sensory protein [bacterium]|nr:tryptophan-rich sensory protein [bacterium]